MSKRALGKGLDALIQSDPGDLQDQSGVLELALDRIEPNDDQPRKSFSRETLDELAASIRENGIIQPIIVEQRADRYRIIAGERRYRAAKIVGLETVPAIVKQYSEIEGLQISLIENIQRENLNPIEEAAAYETLIKQTGLRQEELAQRVGKSRSTIANSLRLLKLTKSFKDALIEGAISPGHGRAILSVVNPADRDVLFSKITKTGLSVREAEELAEKLNSGGRPAQAKTSQRTKAPELRDIEERLIGTLGTKVQLKGSLNGGRIEISYYSKTDLERLFDLLAEA